MRCRDAIAGVAVGGEKRTASPAQNVRLVVALAEAGGTLRCPGVSMTGGSSDSGGLTYSFWRIIGWLLSMKFFSSYTCDLHSKRFVKFSCAKNQPGKIISPASEFCAQRAEKQTLKLQPTPATRAATIPNRRRRRHPELLVCINNTFGRRSASHLRYQDSSIHRTLLLLSDQVTHSLAISRNGRHPAAPHVGEFFQQPPGVSSISARAGPVLSAECQIREPPLYAHSKLAVSNDLDSFTLALHPPTLSPTSRS